MQHLKIANIYYRNLMEFIGDIFEIRLTLVPSTACQVAVTHSDAGCSAVGGLNPG